jgi:hypothetical protein
VGNVQLAKLPPEGVPNEPPDCKAAAQMPSLRKNVEALPAGAEIVYDPQPNDPATYRDDQRKPLVPKLKALSELPVNEAPEPLTNTPLLKLVCKAIKLFDETNVELLVDKVAPDKLAAVNALVAVAALVAVDAEPADVAKVAVAALPVVFWLSVGNVQLAKLPPEGVPNAPPDAMGVYPNAPVTSPPVRLTAPVRELNEDTPAEVGAAQVPSFRKKVAVLPVGAVIEYPFQINWFLRYMVFQVKPDAPKLIVSSAAGISDVKPPPVNTAT